MMRNTAYAFVNESDVAFKPAFSATAQTLNHATVVNFPLALETTAHWKERVLLPLLAGFKAYDFNALTKASLMDRIDTKYLIPRALIPELLQALQPDYAILDIAGTRAFTYENVYFDTDNFQFYTHHHNGKLNRYKVRQRHYVETNTRYMEVKFKNNHKRTVKSRLAFNTNMGEITPEMTDFLQQQGIHETLQVKQIEHYQRIALANEVLGERITLDFGLAYQHADGHWQHLDDVFIVELKQAYKDQNSPFALLMRKFQLKPHSFSKYCIGCCLMYPQQVKVNHFKPILTKIQQFQMNAANRGHYHG